MIDEIARKKEKTWKKYQKEMTTKNLSINSL